MATHIRNILVDLENVPHALDRITRPTDVDLFVYIFHNENQQKRATSIKLALSEKQILATTIQIAGEGKNALDFHIAFFLGFLIRERPQEEYQILSNDTGFDPLVSFTNSNGGKVSRIEISKNKIVQPQKVPSGKKKAEKKKPTTPKKKSSTPKKKKSATPASKPRNTSAGTKKPKTIPKSKATPPNFTAFDERIVELAKNYSENRAGKSFPRTLLRLRNDIKTHLKKHKPDETTIDQIVARLRSLGLSPRSESK